MTNVKIKLTGDGSHTLHSSQYDEQYHSSFGAVNESVHVFINSGLEQIVKQKGTIRILEMGFGTGLNALLTLKWAETHGRNIEYHAVELFPVSVDMMLKLNYPELLKVDREVFNLLHGPGEKQKKLTDYFSLKKYKTDIREVVLPADYFDLTYYDAFSPEKQPELWTEELFRKIGSSMKRGGLLTTYSCKGDVKRALKASGFEIEKLPGPFGKREILRGIFTG